MRTCLQLAPSPGYLSYVRRLSSVLLQCHVARLITSLTLAVSSAYVCLSDDMGATCCHRNLNQTNVVFSYLLRHCRGSHASVTCERPVTCERTCRPASASHKTINLLAEAEQRFSPEGSSTQCLAVLCVLTGNASSLLAHRRHRLFFFPNNCRVYCSSAQLRS